MMFNTISMSPNARGRHLVPPYEKDLDVRLRSTESASRLGKSIRRLSSFISSDMAVDPRNADHFIKSSFSYFGHYAIKASNIGREDTNELFSMNDLGIFRDSPVYSAKDVQWLMKYAARYGLEGKVEYREVGKILKKYYTTRDKEEREKIGKLARKYASDLRSYWEKTKPGEKKVKGKK